MDIAWVTINKTKGIDFRSLWRGLYSEPNIQICSPMASSQRELKFKVNTYLSVNTRISVFFTYTLSRPAGALNFSYIFRCLLCASLSVNNYANYLSVFFSGCGLSDYIFECHFMFLRFTFDFWIKRFMKW